LYVHELDDFVEMGRFLEGHEQPTLTQEEIENLNRMVKRLIGK